jgi:hypothetical protein
LPGTKQSGLIFTWNNGMKNKKIPIKQNDSRSKILFFAGLTGAVILIIILIMLNLPEESLKFNFVENRGMWQLSAGSEFRLTNDSIELIKGQQELFAVIPMNIDADYYNVCVIEGKWPIAYDQGHLLFVSPFNRNFDYNFRYDFDTGRASRQNQRYIDLPAHGAWQGIVKAVLLIPATNAKKMSLKEIRFIHANTWTKIKAWWSGFTRYSDPLLGTCLAMASPTFIGQPFNQLFIPFLWFIILISGVIYAGVYLFNPKLKIATVFIGFLLIIIFLVWSILDLRNNVVYLKGIARNISFYWGKPIQERRGLAVGDQEFIDFMAFCDKYIPLDAQINNQVPMELPGTPANYLRAVQFYANLRPRYYEHLKETQRKIFYIYFKQRNKGYYEVRYDQFQVSRYFNVAPSKVMLQEIKLLHPSNSLFQISIWLKGGINSNSKISLSILSGDRKTSVGKTEFVSQVGDEVIYRYIPYKTLRKNEKAYLEVKNIGSIPIMIGINDDINKESFGEMIIAGRRNNANLSCRLIFTPKTLSVFKRFNEESYILIDREQQ